MGSWLSIKNDLDTDRFFSSCSYSKTDRYIAKMIHTSFWYANHSLYMESGPNPFNLPATTDYGQKIKKMQKKNTEMINNPDIRPWTL